MRTSLHLVRVKSAQAHVLTLSHINRTKLLVFTHIYYPVETDSTLDALQNIALYGDH